jgi:hypothetical protein
MYTHWEGYRTGAVLQSALKRGQSRWSDPSYLTRIIFCDMIEGAERDLTGFGLSPWMTDNGRPILVVYWQSEHDTEPRIKLREEGGQEIRQVDARQFVEFTEEELDKFMQVREE